MPAVSSSNISTETGTIEGAHCAWEAVDSITSVLEASSVLATYKAPQDSYGRLPSAATTGSFRVPRLVVVREHGGDPREDQVSGGCYTFCNVSYDNCTCFIFSLPLTPLLPLVQVPGFCDV